MSEQDYSATKSEHRRAKSPSTSRSRSPRPRSRSPARASNPTNETDESVNPGNNLFVNGLSMKTDVGDLEDLFGKYGKVEKVQIMYDPHTRESRGFAFVTMVRPEDADAAMSVLSGFELHGRAMSVSMARRGRARTPTPGQYRGPPKRERGMGMPYYPYGDRRADRFEPRYDPRGPDPRDYRGAPPMRGGDYGRPAPYDRYDRDYEYDRWMGGARPRYDDRPPRDYRPAPFEMGGRGGYEERPVYDRGGYDRRPPSRYDERYDRY
ncbi:transformer-2 protein [Entomortierella parvispora]|uniref:Transformer-2 protein n=1 Tax=Entomortierella parvispora TaxID=205924 RepID=A0A9P3HI07_9FUNG|nr:transformer-2 protein [Entomortierella parvispora]